MSTWEDNNNRVILKKTRRCGLDSGGLGKGSLAWSCDQKAENFLSILTPWSPLTCNWTNELAYMGQPEKDRFRCKVLYLPRPMRYGSVKPVVSRSRESINGSLNEPSPSGYFSFLPSPCSGNSSLQTAGLQSFLMDESWPSPPTRPAIQDDCRIFHLDVPLRNKTSLLFSFVLGFNSWRTKLLRYPASLERSG